MKHFAFVFIIFVLVSCKNRNHQPEELVKDTRQPSALIEAFQFKKEAPSLVSVHRGGSGLVNYPENCLETLTYIHDSIHAVFEIDVAKAKDGVLVLMHDNTLERTTTGTDKLTKYSFKELQAFNLVDDFGNETPYKIPKFLDVLAWANQHQAILTIDIKKSVDVAEVIDAIRLQNAEDVSIIITYDVEQLKKAYQLAPDLLLSVSARNQKELNWLLDTKIPLKNMLAFTGTKLSDTSLYANIQKLGIKTMLGTLGNLDIQAASKGDSLYITWKNMGIDIFATDRPFQVATVLNINK